MTGLKNNEDEGMLLSSYSACCVSDARQSHTGKQSASSQERVRAVMSVGVPEQVTA